ncbi:hypothetical protein Tco_0959999 [Tanacetum coccineum]
MSKKNKDMYYPRFTKFIINHFMSKDQSILRRNKVDWHMANDDPILNTMRFIPKHETVQRKVISKPKYVRRSTREKTDQAPAASPGKRLKATAKISWKSSDEDDDDEVRLSKDDDDNADNEDADGQDDDNEKTESDNNGDDFVHPKFSTHNEEERQDEEDKDEEGSDLRVQTPSHFESTNNETYDEVTQGDNVEGEEPDEEETNEEEDANVHSTQVIEDTYVIITDVTPKAQQQSSSVSSGFISNMLIPNPGTSVDFILNLNTESTSLVDVPITTNVEMPPSSITTLPLLPIPLVQPQQQTSVPTSANVPSTSLQNHPTFGSSYKFEDRVKALEDDFSKFKQTNLFAKAVSLILGIVDNIKKIIKEKVKIQVKVQVTKILPKIKKSVNEQLEAEVLIRSSNEAKTSHAVAANLSELELKKILIDKMENNKDTVTLKRRRNDEDEDEEPSAGSNRGSKRRRSRKEHDSISALKEKTSKSSGKCKEESKSHQKSTGKSDQAEEPIHTNEDLEEPAHYGSGADEGTGVSQGYPDLPTMDLKKSRFLEVSDDAGDDDNEVRVKTMMIFLPIIDEEERQEELTKYKTEEEGRRAGSNLGSKRRRARKEPESTSASKEKTSKSTGKSKEGSKSHQTSTGKSAQAEEPIHADEDLEEPAHQEFDTGFTEDQPVDETTQHPDWFQKPTKPPTPDRDWNKTLPAKHGPVQPWISTLARNEDPRESFNELMDTPLDFSVFVLNRLKVDTLTPELLAGLTYELMKGSCKSLVELEYFLEEVIDNDLAYLSGGVSSRTYATSVTKTKDADYGHIKWIEDFVSNSMWSQVPIVYDKHALWGISHWGRKRQQFYGFAVNRESAHDVYSKHRILAVTKLKIVEWHNYKHLDWITVRRDDDKLYTFKKGDYNRLRLQDIEDMLLLLV